MNRCRLFRDSRCPVCGRAHICGCAVRIHEEPNDKPEVLRSKDLTLPQAMKWLDELAARYPEEFAEVL